MKMFHSRRRKLEVELLETRYVPTTTTTDPIVPTTDPTTPTTSIPIIDPTEAPSDPSATTVQVTITEVEAPVSGLVRSVVVTGGLTVNNLRANTSKALVIGGVSYYIDLWAQLPNGSFRLMLVNGIPPAAIAVGNTAAVRMGNGAITPVDPPPPPPTPIDPLLDPTEAPQP